MQLKLGEVFLKHDQKIKYISFKKKEKSIDILMLFRIDVKKKHHKVEASRWN